MTHEWKGALRLQIEALARRNDLHRRCTRDSVQKRTKEMEQKIIKMRELLSTNANEAAQFYLECVCHADETERILNRTSSREKRKKDKPNTRVRYISSFTTYDGATSVKSIASSSAVEVISPESLPQSVPQRKWWYIHRKENYYMERKYEVRQLWKSQNDFLSHSMALVIGIGNIIKFPALVYRFSGIVLIPYLLLHLLVGFPLAYLLFCIGQFAAMGPIKAMERIASAASGLGWALVLMAIPFCLYFNVYATWSLFYLTDIVFTSSLPWSSCERNLTSTRSCCAVGSLDSCQISNSTLLSTEAFLHSNILHLSGGLIGALQPSLVAGLAAAWLLTALVYLKSTPTTQFTATFPIFMLIILCLCGSSLPGASIGLSYLFSFNFKKLYSIELWLSCLEQVLFELALCGGPLIPLAALNRFRNNIYRDSAIFVSSTILCSFLAALVVFSFAGNLSHLSGIDVHRLAVFEPRYFTLVILPSMTETVQGGHLWFGLFALAMTLAVVDAQYSWVRLVTSSLLAQFGSKNQRFETRLFLLFSVFGFVLGLPLCTKGGALLFYSIDSLIASWTVTLCLLLLLLLVSHVYGVNNFLRNITCMLRVPLLQRWSTLTPSQRISYVIGPGGLFVKYCWSIATPVILIVATMLFLTTWKRIRIGVNPVPWAYESLAWVLVTAPLLAIPILFGLELHKAWKTGKTFNSILDGSKWSQLEIPQQESDIEPEEEPRSSKRRRAAMRENTYMYIDPLSRGNTERSVTAIQVEDNYGWRVGRLKDFQEDRNLGRSESQNSFEASITSQGTTKEITLFGSPPASNAFLMTEAIRERAAANRRQRAFSTTESVHTTKTTHLSPEGYNRSTSISEPPQIPNTPPPRSSPAAKSEPPRAMTDRPSSSIRSRSQGDSDSEDEDGINPQRVTVIRRFYSTDSVGPQSNTSISITPCDRMTDVDRQRSMSSLAIYDPQSEFRPRQTLSQLKRPQPINAPNKSPSRF